MIRDPGIKKRLSNSSQFCQRAFFVDPNQSARASNIRRQNCRQSPLDVLAAHDVPRSGKLDVHIAQLWADVWLPASEMGQSLPKRVIRTTSAFSPDSEHFADALTLCKSAKSFRRGAEILLADVSLKE
jgi:hypothetical protein